MSIASGRAGLVSGSGSISPGRSRLISSAEGPASPPVSRIHERFSVCMEWSLPGPARPNSSFSFASASSNSFWYLSRHCVAVLPTIGAMVLHCVGINLARCSSFSSSAYKVMNQQTCRIIKGMMLKSPCSILFS
jgi:hypothetical protein